MLMRCVPGGRKRGFLKVRRSGGKAAGRVLRRGGLEVPAPPAPRCRTRARTATTGSVAGARAPARLLRRCVNGCGRRAAGTGVGFERANQGQARAGGEDEVVRQSGALVLAEEERGGMMNIASHYWRDEHLRRRACLRRICPPLCEGGAWILDVSGCRV